jgi:tetratricopeptide (TPR) repeat protein
VDAVFSGQAGTLAFIEGSELRVHHVSGIDSEITIAREDASYLFQGCNDTVLLRGVQQEFALAQLTTAWEADRALRLMLLSVDPEEGLELRIEAADCLESLLSKEESKLFIENQLYSHRLPRETDLKFFTTTSKWPIAAKLIDRVVRQQATIIEVRKAWDELPIELFDNGNIGKVDFEENAIRKGAFRILASFIGLPNDDPNLVILNCHQALSSLPNARTVVSEWTQSFKRPRSKRIIVPEGAEEIVGETEQINISSHDAYERAIQQQQAIIDKMRSGSQGLARTYAEELVQFQLKRGGPEYAAKSLCNLAQQAKHLSLYSLQLEWAQRAADVCPSDAWAHGQAADALIQFSRLDEALKELDLTESWGDRQFAVTGRARVLRHQGRLDEALTAFRSARVEFSGHEEERFTWTGSAETLRDMWKFEDALREYDQAIQRFPDELQFRCGRAAVLSDLGRLDEALEAYDAPELHDDLIALNGKASVFKELGRFQEALTVVSRTVEIYPTDPIARCIHADILRSKGDLIGALQIYSNVKADYPTISAAYSGYAEVLRDMRKLPAAIAAYEVAIERFSYDVRLANGYANIRKVNYELEESLRLYEKNVRQFPYDLISKSGRADLLKRLGHFDDAITAYDAIIKIWPSYEPAKNGKAAILVLRGEMSQAISLLPTGFPATRNEWIAYHIRGMILLQRNQLDAAIRFFGEGGRATPFAREKRYFDGALSVARMRKGQFKEAAISLRDTGGGLSRVLRFHAYAGMGNRELAVGYYDELVIRCPTQLLDLKEAIAGRFGITSPMSHHNDNWIFRRESEALLLEAA